MYLLLLNSLFLQPVFGQEEMSFGEFALGWSNKKMKRRRELYNWLNDNYVLCSNCVRYNFERLCMDDGWGWATYTDKKWKKIFNLLTARFVVSVYCKLTRRNWIDGERGYTHVYARYKLMFRLSTYEKDTTCTEREKRSTMPRRT